MANGVAITKPAAAKKTAASRRKTAARKVLTLEQLYEEAYWRAYKDDIEGRLGMNKAEFKAHEAKYRAIRERQRRIRNGEEEEVLTPEEQRDHDEFWGDMEKYGGMTEAEYNKIIAEVRRDIAEKDGGLRERMAWRDVGITAKHLRRMKREGRIAGPLPAFARKDMSDGEIEAAYKKQLDDDGWTEVVERARREGRLVEFEYPKVKTPRE